MKMLHVCGREYAALDFEELINKKDYIDIWNKAMESERNRVELAEYISVIAYEFDKVDDRFVDFIEMEMLDYDNIKHENFYFVDDANDR